MIRRWSIHRVAFVTIDARTRDPTRWCTSRPPPTAASTLRHRRRSYYVRAGTALLDEAWPRRQLLPARLVGADVAAGRPRA
jgi:hypothetical protein